MNTIQVEQLLAVNGGKIPLEAWELVKRSLMEMDLRTANLRFSMMKDPTISIILSILLGQLGIDRFYIGDIGLGVLKLITCGGAGIWWIVDLFLIMNETRAKNLRLLQTGIFILKIGAHTGLRGFS